MGNCKNCINCLENRSTPLSLFKKFGGYALLQSVLLVHELRKQIQSCYYFFLRKSRILDDCSLAMEYMPNGSLMDYILANNDNIYTCRRLQWIMGAADGLQLLHSENIIHCDVEPKTFRLDAGLGLKITDFSGSSINGSRASAWVGTRFERPGHNLRCVPTVKVNLFSFGSTI